MKSEPLVTVVLCTYNDEKYIAKTIQSVLDQTYKDFEFIIWNDGSTDNTKSIVQSFNDERIHYFHHENTGLGIALKLACMEARGKYLARIDGDDICIPERFEKQVDFLEKHLDYVLVSSSVIFIDSEGESIGRSFPVTWHSNIKAKLKDSNPISHPAAMFRKDAYFSSGGYQGFKSAQDRMLWSQLIKYGKFKNFEEPLVYYRVLNSSITSGWNNNPYKPVIEALRSKICTDIQIEEQDVELYNIINEKCRNRKIASFAPYVKSTEEKVYSLLKKVVGERFSAHIVFFFKNSLYRLLRS